MATAFRSIPFHLAPSGSATPVCTMTRPSAGEEHQDNFPAIDEKTDDIICGNRPGRNNSKPTSKPATNFSLKPPPVNSLPEITTQSTKGVMTCSKLYPGMVNSPKRRSPTTSMRVIQSSMFRPGPVLNRPIS